MKKGGFSKNATVLAVFLLLSKVLGALYRVPLLNILGAEGIGMYQLAYSIYALIISFTTGGVTSLISKITAERIAKGEDTKKLIIYFLLGAFLVSSIISIILVMLRSYISGFQGNQNISILYFYIAPSIVFVSLMTVIRGWFQGKCNVIPSSISEIIEGLFKLTFGLILSKVLIRRGIIYGVIGAVIGLTLSEFLALLYVVISYIVAIKRDKTIYNKLPQNTNIKELLKQSFQYSLFGFIIPFSQFIDGILIVNLLKWQNMSASLATALYGIFSGTVMSIVNLPVFLTIAITTVLIPIISRHNINRNIQEIMIKTETSIKLSLFISVPIFLIFTIFSDDIIGILYNGLSTELKSVCIKLLRITSISIVFTSLREIVSSILLSLGFIKRVFFNNVLGVILKTLCIVLLILKVGIIGIGWAINIFQITLTILNLNYLIFVLGKNPKLNKNISKILISGAIMSILAFIYNMAFEDWSFYIGGIISVAVYIGLVYLLNAFQDDEIISITKRKKLKVG